MSVMAMPAVAGFEQSVTVSSNDGFCLDCHHHEVSSAEYKTNQHESSAYTFLPCCADYHLPHEFVPKVKYEIVAGRER